ncbi:hypothetical protein [Mesorhizobium sp.]|jgi:hypothetical protein|uniref:hypothetical protein n=1 Tax=Mesorhizobium sp. TaxID=1871066 RepID=UPI00257E632D|nr:hypothetical protein [Mesorhizobium sp.]
MTMYKAIAAMLVTAALTGCAQTEGQQRLCRYQDRSGHFYTALCDGYYRGGS